jgi:hypothetical protein
MQVTRMREAMRRHLAPQKNKAVGGVLTPTALPAPDIKLACAIRH